MSVRHGLVARPSVCRHRLVVLLGILAGSYIHIGTSNSLVSRCLLHPLRGIFPGAKALQQIQHGGVA